MSKTIQSHTEKKKSKFHTRHCINKHTRRVPSSRQRGKCPFPAPESEEGEGEEHGALGPKGALGPFSAASSSSTSMAVFEDSLAAVCARGSGFIERKVNMQGFQGDLESMRLPRCLLQSSAIGN